MTETSLQAPSEKTTAPTTSKVVVRVLIVAAIFAAMQVTLLRFGSGGLPTDTTLPTWQLADLPMQLGEWQGRELLVDEDLVGIDHSFTRVNRIYESPGGQWAVVYAAVFTEVVPNIAPHPPSLCYRGAGYEIANSAERRTTAEGSGAFSTNMLLAQRGDEALRILYWYQTPDKTYVNSYGQRDAFLPYRGQASKPAVTKVMMHTEETGGATAALQQLAAQIHAWIQTQTQTQAEAAT
jgi:EpsI family protein